jgi:hypothetical protein
MFNVGDTVRFHAETEDWTLDDWAMEPGDGFSQFIERLDGVLAEVTEVEVAGPDGEVLYVDLVFQDGEMLDAVCVTHLEPIDRKVRVLAARAA